MSLEPLADASVEQHNVRPQSSERQHVRSAGGDPERAARVVPAQAGTRKADAPGSAAPPSGADKEDIYTNMDWGFEADFQWPSWSTTALHATAVEARMLLAHLSNHRLRPDVPGGGMNFIANATNSLRFRFRCG